MGNMQIGEVFRYSNKARTSSEIIDDFRNHFYVTHLPGHNQVQLEKGINPIADIKAIDGKRKPAILIRSSPHKTGTDSTPWQDIFDVDNGHIRYYGDNKTPGKDPALAPGNKALLEAFDIYNNVDKRRFSTPLLFYKAVIRNKKAKGFIQFNGFGIIKGVELIAQYDRKNDRTFSNYAFNFHVFSIVDEKEEFNWNWINDRRTNTLNLDQTLRNAPLSWKDWIKQGNSVLEKNRRRVSKLRTVNKGEQIPKSGSKEEKILKEVYAFYYGKKPRFEGLASVITGKILRDSVGKYQEKWITPSTSDGGADFYGLLEIGSGFGKAKLIVLGQAKCEVVSSATGGNHIARTVARLKRGWLGVYVTTSYFSEAVQREIIEDGYPIMLIHGLKLAETLLKILHDDGYSDVSKYLEKIDVIYDRQVQIRRPDELLFE